jgi:hypothetical protein
VAAVEVGELLGRSTEVGEQSGPCRKSVRAIPGAQQERGCCGGYSCETDDVAQFAVATILGVVAIMAAPEVAGVLAGGAALNYFLGWSTVGMITWGAGHLMVC